MVNKKSAMALLFLGAQALACNAPIATSTIYYTPDARVQCGAYNKKCKTFVSDVNIQGSGILSPTKLLRYTGKEEKRDPACPTTKGAAGVCLIPYISVAADARYWNMGDIVSMPGMKGKKITLADGSTFTHPGFFIVHDTGGAIKGSNRFDFYTGTLGPSNEKNSFGYKGESTTTMYSKKSCPERKRYSRLKPSSKGFAEARSAIEKSINGSGSKSGVQSTRGAK